MTKLTPARKALLQKLVGAGGEKRKTNLWPEEVGLGTRMERFGWCGWNEIMGRKYLSITDAGRAALKEAGE